MHVIAATTRNTVAIDGFFLAAIPALTGAMDSDCDVDRCAGTGNTRLARRFNETKATEGDVDEKPAV